MQRSRPHLILAVAALAGILPVDARANDRCLGAPVYLAAAAAVTLALLL
jgi:hypothetical protein